MGFIHHMILYTFKNFRLIVIELLGLFLICCVLFIAIPEQMNSQETTDFVSDLVYSSDYDLARICAGCLLFMVNFAVTIIDYIGEEDPDSKEKTD